MVVVAYYYASRGDKQSAMHWFTRAAETGDASGTGAAADAYLCGYGFAKDTGRALVMLERAARLGHSWSARTLGNLYELGEGVPQDSAKAMAWYELSGSLDYARALYQGVGAPPDPVRAYQVLRSLVEKPGRLNVSSEAMYHLALMYRGGIGVEPNPREAERLLRMVEQESCCASVTSRQRAAAILKLRTGPAM